MANENHQKENNFSSFSRLALTTKTGEFFSWMQAWASASSLWPLPFGSSCCATEFMAAMAPRLTSPGLDFQHITFSPSHADLLVVSGTVTEKQLPIIKHIYENMPSPKWVMAVGACSASGGVFNSYSVLQGIDRFIPVDIYVPGCPPRPEDILEGVKLLRETIRSNPTKS